MKNDGPAIGAAVPADQIVPATAMLPPTSGANAPIAQN